MAIGRSNGVLVLNWRDTAHPEGGGSEVYVEQLADGLAAQGRAVTVVCARYPGAPDREHRPSGAQIIRLGGRFTVYPRAAAAYLRGRLGVPQTVIEVQNGVPFLARIWARRSYVIVLVHHVHREQWHVVLPAPLAGVGWWVESRLAPRVNRRTPYVAVSQSTRDELGRLGVPREHITVVPNGTPPSDGPATARSRTPRLLVVGRLVPHKRVEIAIDALAELVPEFPDLTLDVAGRGWWDEQLRNYAQARGMAGRIRFHGYVDEPTKARLYQAAWVSLIPSLKEGWGLTVMEAGTRGTPSVGFRAAGGLVESVHDGQTGLLADDPAMFTAHVARLLRDSDLRERLGAAACAYARTFTWAETVHGFSGVLDRVASTPHHDGRLTRDHAGACGASGARPVVHRRRLNLLGSRLRGRIDTQPGERGEHGGHKRGQRDAHPDLPRPDGAELHL
jgi:glycosyltransferase involved in cell wall biosynthesis